MNLKCCAPLIHCGTLSYVKNMDKMTISCSLADILDERRTMTWRIEDSSAHKFINAFNFPSVSISTVLFLPGSKST